MERLTTPGQIVILNGAPRSGKSSIVTAIQETFTPKRYLPGMGLRPGEEGHTLAPLVPALYEAMYESVAAHSRAGLVGVRCPIEAILERRTAGQTGREGEYLTGSKDAPIPPRSFDGNTMCTCPASTTARWTPQCSALASALPRSADTFTRDCRRRPFRRLAGGRPT